MQKIFILNPPSPFFTDHNRYLRHLVNSLPSAGICSLGGMMKAAGWHVSLLDAAALGLSIDHCLQAIIQFNPDILGISTYSASSHIAHRIAHRVKAHNRDIIILAGGPHVTAVGATYMDRVKSDIDFAVLGEGEATLVDLTMALKTGLTVSAVPGIMYRSFGRWLKTVSRKPINDLDELPDPAWELLPGFPEQYQPPIFSYTKGPAAPLITSRGCPHQCAFCDHSVFGYRYRTHSIPRIIDMITTLQRTFGIHHILFVDDHLSLDKKRLTRLCNMLVQKKITINWTADVRADSLSVEDLSLMKQAGCVRINCGLETGAPELLQLMNKKLDLERAENTLSCARILGIQTKGLFMVGFPGENKDTIGKTIHFLKRIELTEINVSKFAPYPGTLYYEKFRGTKPDSVFWKCLDGFQFCEADEGRNQWLEQKFKQILHAFYSQPKVIHSYLRMIWNYKESRGRLFAFLKAFLKMKIKIDRNRDQDGHATTTDQTD